MPQTPSAQKPHAVAGRYVLFGEIASGGMATVHYGRLLGQAGFTRTVAIKRIHAHCASDPDFTSMFLDEARLVGRIRHPNVVPVLDVVAEGGELSIVMEYVQGQTLWRLMRAALKTDRRPPIRVVGAIMTGVLEGLHAAHIAVSDQGEPLGIVHRDVSPQNVMVGVDGVARVLDFGIAKARGRLQTTRDGQLKGKLQYMAPEQLRNCPADRQTDIYAAAVVLWEMLAGRRLFAAENEAALMCMVLGSDIPALRDFAPSIPEALEQVVSRGLRADPAERFETAEQMAIALEDATGVASPREVSRWVESVASDVLRARAAEIAEVESVSSDFDLESLRRIRDEGTPVFSADFGGVLDTADVISGQRLGTPIHSLPQAARASSADGTDLAGRADAGVDDEVQSFAGSRRRRQVMMAAVAAAFVVTLVVMVLVMRSGDTTPEPTADMAPPSDGALLVASSGSVALPGSAAPIVSLAAAPSGFADPADSGPTDAAHPASGAPARDHAGSPGTRGTGSMPGPPKDDCNPPYVIDKEGLRAPKPQCL